MGPASVPEEEHVAAQVAQEVAQEGTHLLLLDVLEVELEVEVEAPVSGTDRDARDGGDAITPVEVP